MSEQPIKKVQDKILEIMIYIDKICRDNQIHYWIMGGTALGAVRHNGFIPWDDDLDIFMTPEDYYKFKSIIRIQENDEYELQEWSVIDDYLGYSKLRMNGTTFIEKSFKTRNDMHHGIYVDIMMLHKCPNNILHQKIIYYASKYIVLLGLSQRGWQPKTISQKIALNVLKFLPNKTLAKLCYKLIYKYDNLTNEYSYCYFLTKAKFDQGIFDKKIFSKPINIEFENIMLLGSPYIERYLEIRYGDYMKFPSVEEQNSSIHAEIYDTEISYEYYLK